MNLADIFGRMLMKTHPVQVVAAEKRQIRCGRCFKLGHSARSQVHHGSMGLVLSRKRQLLLKNIINSDFYIFEYFYSLRLVPNYNYMFVMQFPGP